MKSTDLKNSNDVLKYLREHDLPENFCIIPFINLILGPGGDVSICRQKGSKHVVGHLNKNSISEIWNNEYLQRWRQEFLDGKPKICEHETKYVHCHLAPEHYWNTSLTDLKKEMPYPFKKLTANFNGECNMKCVMCDVWKQENNYYDEDNFWNEARTSILPYIQEIEMLSGEPLIQEDTFRLIDEALEINPKIQWSFTTNGFWTFEGRIEESLKKIPIKRFIFSIDSLNPEKYRKIRIGGKLEEVLLNVEKIAKFGHRSSQPFSVTIHFLVMRNNFEEVAPFLQFCRENQIKYILDLCEFPNALSILTLDDTQKKMILDKWLDQSDRQSLQGMSGIVIRLLSQLESVEKKGFLIKLMERIIDQKENI